MDLQQFEQSPPSPYQQQQPDDHDHYHNHGDDDAESVQENSIEQTNTGFDKDLDLNTECN